MKFKVKKHSIEITRPFGDERNQGEIAREILFRACKEKIDKCGISVVRMREFRPTPAGGFWDGKNIQCKNGDDFVRQAMSWHKPDPMRALRNLGVIPRDVQGFKFLEEG